MLKIKYENRRELNRVKAEYEAYIKFNALLRLINWLLIAVAFGIALIPRISMAFALITLALVILMNILKLPELLIDQITDCPCAVKEFRKEYKKIRDEYSLLIAYETLREDLPCHPEAELVKSGRRFSINYRRKLPVSIFLPGRWKGKRQKDAYIDFDAKEIRKI